MTEIQTPDLVARVLNKEHVERKGIIAQINLIEEIPKRDKHSKVSKIEIYDVLLTYKNGNVDRYYIAILNRTSEKDENKIVKNFLGNNYPSEEQIKKLFYARI